MKEVLGLSGLLLAMMSLSGCTALDEWTEGNDDRVIVAEPNLREQAHEPLLPGSRTRLERIGPNEFRVACEGLEQVAAKQETDVWCWAACAVMIRRWNGDESMSQEDIAQRIHGAEDSVKTASMNEIIAALAPDAAEERDRIWEAAGEMLGSGQDVHFDLGQMLSAAYEQSTTNSDLLVEDLAAGNPAVVGLRDSKSSLAGHAYVAHAATYSHRDPTASESWTGIATTLLNASIFSNGGERELDESAVERLDRTAKNYGLWSVELIDPLDGRSKTLTAQEFADRVDFMISAREARALIESESKVWVGAENGSRTQPEGEGQDY